MPLYIGGNKKSKVTLGGVVYNFNIYREKPPVTGIKLLTFDNYTLKDSKGLYLTVKESN